MDEEVGADPDTTTDDLVMVWGLENVTRLENVRPLLGSCSRTKPNSLWWSQGGGVFLMGQS